MISQDYAMNNLVQALDLISQVEFDNDYYRVTTFKKIIETIINNMTICEYRKYKDKNDKYGRTKYHLQFPMYDFVKEFIELQHKNTTEEEKKEEEKNSPQSFIPDLDLQPPFIPLMMDAKDLDSTKGVYIP